MKKETFLLKIAIVLIGIPILALCIYLLPHIVDEVQKDSEAQGLSYMSFAILIMFLIMYLSAIPFYLALFQAFKLLRYIDDNEAFSELSVKALKNIKKYAVAISILYILDMPLIYLIAEGEDAPGIILLGLMVIFVSIVIAIFSAVLQKLLKNAIDIKSENDLTV